MTVFCRGRPAGNDAEFVHKVQRSGTVLRTPAHIRFFRAALGQNLAKAGFGQLCFTLFLASPVHSLWAKMLFSQFACFTYSSSASPTGCFGDNEP